MGPCHGTLRCRWGPCGTFVGGTWIALLLKPSLRLCRRIPRLSWVVLSCLATCLASCLASCLARCLKCLGRTCCTISTIFSLPFQLFKCQCVLKHDNLERPRQQGEVPYLITFKADAFFLPLASDSNLLQSLLVCVSDLMLRGALSNQERVRQQNNIC